MQLEEAIKVLKNMDISIYGEATCKECIFEKARTCFQNNKDCQMVATETVLQELENSIPKEVIKEKNKR